MGAVATPISTAPPATTTPIAVGPSGDAGAGADGPCPLAAFVVQPADWTRVENEIRSGPPYGVHPVPYPMVGVDFGLRPAPGLSAADRGRPERALRVLRARVRTCAVRWLAQRPVLDGVSFQYVLHVESGAGRAHAMVDVTSHGEHADELAACVRAQSSANLGGDARSTVVDFDVAVRFALAH